MFTLLHYYRPCASCRTMAVLKLIVALQVFISVAESSTVCSPTRRISNLAGCLDGIKTLSGINSHFWFGTEYNTRCSGSKALTMECSNARPNDADSLVTRLGISNNNLGIFMDVKYQSMAGSYTSCGNQYTVSQSRNIDLDPSSDDQLTPWETKMAPNITWESPSQNDTYSLVVVDAGMFINHGIYLNIPGNRFTSAEVFKAYHGPRQFYTSFANVYVFLLFKQEDSNLTISEHWAQKLNKTMMEYTIPEMMTALNLSGPVAMNWMNVIGDAYAVQKLIDGNVIYMCPYLIQNELKQHNRSFIPSDPMMSVNIDLTFSPSEIMFKSCCKDYSYPAKTFTPSPFGNVNVKTEETRVIPMVQLDKSGPVVTRNNFTGSMYTLLCVDPDVPYPSAGTQDRPWYHWHVSNIENGDVSTGDVVMAYTGPMPPDNNPHYYYFLLYEQKNDLDTSDFRNYTEPPGSRLLFNISGFVMDNNLTLVGATWMIATNDPYARYYYANDGGQNETTVCSGVQGYDNPCPVSKATSVIATWCIILISVCTIALTEINEKVLT